jgi:hypothetical protein
MDTDELTLPKCSHASPNNVSINSGTIDNGVP